MTTYEVYCNDQLMASAIGRKDLVEMEAFRYARQYREEGRVTIKCGKELIAIFSQIHPQDSRLSGREVAQQENAG